MEYNKDDRLFFEGTVFEKINPIVERIVRFLFRKVTFETASLKTLRDYANKKIVYASFHTSNLSLLILYTLLKRHGFKTPAAALDYNPFMFQPMKFLFRRIIRWIEHQFAHETERYNINFDHVSKLIENGESVLFSLLSKKHFIRRYMEIATDTLYCLVEIQKNIEEPIYLLPQIIFWNMNPERAEMTLSAHATGARGIISGWFAILRSITPSFIRIGQPINLKEEIASSSTNDSRHIAASVRNKLLEIYHYEKRSVLGPVIKPRQVLAEKTLNHKNVLDAIKRIAVEKGKSESSLRKRAFKYYDEIAANFSITMIRFFEIALDIMFRKIFDGINYHPEEIEMIREASQKGPLIIMPCHKSHMDYLIVSYIFYKNKMIPPHIAAGVNLSFFPMGFIFRHSGAFFMRRTFKGLDLYPEVFKQYIKTMINEGYTIEFFIEGGRSRTGKLSYPRYGFLNFLIESIDEGYNRDLVFVPVSISYERILEETSYVQEMRGKPKEAESAKGMLESTTLLQRKYGRVYVRFNKPFTLKEIESIGIPKENRAKFISEHIVKKINEITTVTPFALVSAAVLLHPIKGFNLQSLMSKISLLYRYLAFIDVPMSETLQRKANLEQIADTVLRSFMSDKIIEPLKEEQDFYTINEDQRPRIVFYKNGIIHYLIPIAFYSLAILHLQRQNNLNSSKLHEEYDRIKTIFSAEFIYSSYQEGEGTDAETAMLNYFNTEALVHIENEQVSMKENAEDNLKVFARLVRDFLESYFIVLHTLLVVGKKRAIKRDVIQEIRKNGIKLIHTGEIRLMEALSLPNYNTALTMLVNTGIAKETSLGRKGSEFEIIDRDGLKKLFETISEYLLAIN
ncbi:MAG: 1-acyl-sn-glycerol-3-phosphate acyltransferase [Spirochaetes bacterium]|nr:1-acyl-sn-glycerol-3-phosphate acyltransferase [Spirochaetota bacterium]